MDALTDVRAPDGRTLRVHEDGDPDGVAIVVHHGTPSSGLLYPPHAQDAAERGIRLVGYDRPGYGGSTPQPGRRGTGSVLWLAQVPLLRQGGLPRK